MTQFLLLNGKVKPFNLHINSSFLPQYRSLTLTSIIMIYFHSEAGSRNIYKVNRKRSSKFSSPKFSTIDLPLYITARRNRNFFHEKRRSSSIAKTENGSQSGNSSWPGNKSLSRKAPRSTEKLEHKEHWPTYRDPIPPRRPANTNRFDTNLLRDTDRLCRTPGQLRTETRWVLFFLDRGILLENGTEGERERRRPVRAV